MSEVLIAIIAIVCLVSYKGFNDRVFFDKYKFNVGAIQSGQKYRMFTSAFLHGDISHLIFNLLIKISSCRTKTTVSTFSII